jgi:thiol-disulfide isomerase/thioredoxin
MKKIFFFNCLLVLFISCNGQINGIEKKEMLNTSNESKNTYIKAELRGTSFFYTDSFGRGNNFSFSSVNILNHSSPIFLFQSDQLNTPFIIFPGDSLFLKEYNNDITITSFTNHQRTEELAFLKNMVKKTGAILYDLFLPQEYFNKEITTIVQIKLIEKLILEKKGTREKMLISFAEKNKTDSLFIKTISDLITADYFNEQLLLKWKCRNLLLSKNNFYNSIDSLNKIIYSFPFSCNPAYLHLLNNSVSIRLTKYRDHSVSDISEMKAWYDYVKLNTLGLTQSFLTANILRCAMKKNISIPIEYERDFFENCIDSNYKRNISQEGKIKFLSNRLNTLESDDYLITPSLKKKASLGKIITDNKQKILLIDFWASWCSPCRQESPYLKQLETIYSSNKFLIISISTDENLTNWLKAIEDDKLVISNNYCIIKNTSTDLIKKFNISTIPRYMLIGKNGKIISEDAPRPSDPKLKMLIDKYINQ